MKKLFEKDIVRFTFVLTVVSLACGLVIGGVNAITAPIIAQNQLTAKLEAYESVLPGIQDFTELDTAGDPESIQDKIEGKDADDAVLGYIFVASGNNKYGSMTMVVSVDATGLILGATFSAIEQTYQVDSTRNNLALFIGTNIMDLSPMGDIETGATGSFHTLEDLLADIKASFETLDIPEPELPEDPYEVMFDESLGFAYSEEDTTFSPSSELIVSKSIAYDGDDNVIGSVYKLVGSGIYNDGSPTPGELALYVALSEEGTILGYMMPKDEYHHTLQTNHYLKNEAFLDSIIGDPISALDGNTDVISGATNTYNVIISLLNALAVEVTA
ncbi:MAG: hypothetical protein K9K93_01600 [Acholeplasmataceae bacterium]|nr:hypothetical protein [Acholeplasmataceae bacterium]